MGATLAWDITNGSSAVKVAVLDSGIPLTPAGGLTHEDLANGTRIIPGPDFVEGDGDTVSRDQNGHGTHVAGIIGAQTNNAKGVGGVAPGTKILAIQVADANKYIESPWLQQGIVYAVDAGARVLNLSLGQWVKSGSEPQIITEAIEYAGSHGAIVIAGAGNLLAGSPSDVWYPASLSDDHDNVVAVSALTNQGEFAEAFSCHGPEVWVSAPGGEVLSPRQSPKNIYSTFPNYQASSWPLNYGYNCGTSMATAFVSGVAALVLSASPSLSPGAVKETLRKGVYDADPDSRDDYYGYGPAHAALAVTIASGAPMWPADLVLHAVTEDDEPILTWQAGQHQYVSASTAKYEVWRTINYLGGPPGAYSKIAEVQAPATTYTELGLAVGGTWRVYYKVRGISSTGKASIFSDTLTVSAAGFFKRGGLAESAVPGSVVLHDVYPNPCNPTAVIGFRLPAQTHVTMEVYSVVGERVATLADGIQEAGYHQTQFDGTALATGVYVVRLRAGTIVLMRQVVLIR